MRTSSLAAGLAVALSLVGAIALAAGPAHPLDPRVDTRIWRALELGRNGPPRHALHPGVTRVMVELKADADDAALASLEAAGAALTRAEGRVVYYHRFVPAFVTAQAATKIVALPGVARVRYVGHRGRLPLDRSAELMHLADARGAHQTPDLVTGAGVLIGDIDSMTDPFHPTFFKGDGGYFDWIDVDGDGVFTPGKDAIDLDRDGKAGPGETAQVITAMTIDEYDTPIPAARTAGFDPGIDWLYLDTNGDGQRNYGAASGFTDATPAFGEPLFVPDDFNKNGKLDVGERVVRLSTSKFRKIFVEIAGDVVSGVSAANDVYVRGMNLSSTKVNYTDDKVEGYPDALHATGVDTILVGDVPLVGRRWVGIAPDAELVVGWEVSDEYYPLDATMFALNEKAGVMLYELAPWTGDPLDGTDALSTLIDSTATTDASITHVCPTGDQGSARKHTQAMVAANTVVTQALDVPQYALGLDSTDSSPIAFVEISLNIRGGTAAALELVGPQGDIIDLASTTTTSGTVTSGAAWALTNSTSSRGTAFTDFEIYDPDGTHPLDIGTWTVQVTGGATAITVDSYVQDDESSWGAGAAWDASIATDVSTVGIPSVADHCIAVNAIPDHLDMNGMQTWYDMSYWDYDVPTGYMDAVGQIRAYTPRGPRIDGTIKPDVAAPDNPWVAAEHTGGEPYAYGAFRLFGGTSGASPHVTGVAALLAQLGTFGDAARDAIRNGADHDSITGTVPNGDYGYGRLNAAGALGVTTVGSDFTASLTASSTTPTVGENVTLTASGMGTGDAIAGLSAEWDDGYDGTWDVPYAANAPRVVSAKTPGRYAYKVRLRNAAGHVAEAVVYLTFTAATHHGGCGCEVGARRAPPTSPMVWLAFAAGALLLRRRAVRSRRASV